MKTNAQPQVIKVDSIREEKLYIAKTYPEFVLTLQKLTSIRKNGKEIPCDVLVGETNEGVKEFWFDISSFYGQSV